MNDNLAKKICTVDVVFVSLNITSFEFTMALLDIFHLNIDLTFVMDVYFQYVDEF